MLATHPQGPHTTSSPPPLKKAKRSHTGDMATFTLPDTDVPVQLIDGLSEEELLQFPAFKESLIPKFILSLIPTNPHLELDTNIEIKHGTSEQSQS
jgi:hypothetical protein